MRFGTTLLLFLIFLPSFLGAQEVEQEFLTPEAVQRAIDGAIDYLRSSQRPDGSWEGFPGYEPGGTALTLLSLLSAGVPKDDPMMVSGLKYLRGFPREQKQWQTYPISLQTMVLCQADPEQDRALIERNVRWLCARQFQTENPYRGGWSYTGDVPESSRTDNSNSQFASLALYEADRAGFEVDRAVWEGMRDYWIRMQNSDGSWGYKWTPDTKKSVLPSDTVGSGQGTGSMTCAGITALVIAGSVSDHGAARYSEGKILCCQPVEEELNDKIDRALAWLGKHFSVRHNPGTDINADSWLFYYLYGLERVGRLTSHRFIGDSDWYREGADFLLRKKGMLNKYWKAGTDLERVNAVSTSFALLFLSKGRWPVLISKLRYSASELPEGDSWNLHPNELDHLTRYTEKCWGKNLTWQVIDSSKATVDDYIQTPVLYLSGRLSPLPEKGDDRKKFVDGLRGYLEQGGFIFAEALDGDQSFQNGFFELMKEIFPEESNGGLHLLNAEHPIWNLEVSIPPKRLRPLYGVDFGCRTCVVFIPRTFPDGETSSAPSFEDVPESISCLWEIAGNRHLREPLSAEASAKVSAALGLGLNILSYATGRDLKYKEEVPEKALSETLSQPAGGLYAAILDHGSGSRCAPKAIPNLMKRLESEFGISVSTEVGRVKASSDDIFQYPVLFLHGRTALRFTEDQVNRLRLYFDRGGFLFSNAICAAPAFQKSLIEEIKRIFPNDTLQPIPPEDPLFTDQYGGFRIEKLQIHKPVARKNQPVRSELTNEPPRLYGIQRDGRWVLIVSPYDVSCALEGRSSVECSGYSEQSAYQLSINILLYAVEHL